MLSRVFTTDFGSAREADLPEDIKAKLQTALFTKRGGPDKRSPRSVEVWQAIQDHMRAKWASDSAYCRNESTNREN